MDACLRGTQAAAARVQLSNTYLIICAVSAAVVPPRFHFALLLEDELRKFRFNEGCGASCSAQGLNVVLEATREENICARTPQDERDGLVSTQAS